MNTCWTGTFDAKNVPAEIKGDERFVIVIAIGYGADQGRQHKLKKPEKLIVSDGDKTDWFNFGVKMAIVAPTVPNQQKFEIALNEDGFVKFTDKGGMFSKADLGIVKYHFEVGAVRNIHILK